MYCTVPGAVCIVHYMGQCVLYSAWSSMYHTVPGAATVPGAVCIVQYLGQYVLYSTWDSLFCTVPETEPGVVCTVHYLGQCVLYSTWDSIYCSVSRAVCTVQYLEQYTLYLGHCVIYRVDRYSCHPLISPIIMCQSGEKQQNRILNWPTHQMTETKTCHPKKLQSPGLATPEFTKVLDSANFWGWQVLDSVISEGGQFRTLLFFSIMEHRKIRGWQE